MSFGFKTIWIPLAGILSGCWAGNPFRLESPSPSSEPEPTPTALPLARILIEDLEFLAPKPTLFYGSLSRERTDVFARSIPDPQSPCVVEPLKVFERIPEYLRIRTLGLDDRDPEYWILLAKANEKFYLTIRKTIKDLETYDTVIRRGHVQLAPGSKATAIPDITHEVIERLEP